MDRTVVKPGQLGESTYSPTLRLISYNPFHVPNPNDPDDKATKALPISEVASAKINWNLQSNPVDAKLYSLDFDLLDEPKYIDSNTVENNGSAHFLRLGKNNLDTDGKYAAVAAIHSPSTTENITRIVFGPLSTGLAYAYIAYKTGVGLVWGNDSSADHTSVIDANYTQGAYFYIFLDTTTNIISVVTEARNQTNYVPLVAKEIYAFGIYQQVTNRATLVNNGRVYLGTDVELIAPTVLFPPDFADYHLVRDFGNPLIPAGAKIGDFLKITHKGSYKGIEYLPNEYAIIISITEGIVFPIDNAKRFILDTRTVLVPTDFDNLNQAIDYYSNFSYGPKGNIDLIIEDGYVLTDIDQVNITHDFSWLTIRTQNINTVYVTNNTETLFTIQASGKIEGIYGKFTNQGNGAAPKLLALYGELQHTGDQTQINRNGLEAVDYNIGAFDINPIRVGQFVRLVESVAPNFAYAQGNGSSLTNFNPRYGIYKTNKKLVNVSGHVKVGVINTSTTVPAQVVLTVDPTTGDGYRANLTIVASGLITLGYVGGDTRLSELDVRILGGLSNDGFVSPPKLGGPLDIRGQKAYLSLENILPPNNPHALANVTANHCRIDGQFKPSADVSYFTPSYVFIVGKYVTLDVRKFDPFYVEPNNSKWFGRNNAIVEPNFVQDDGTLCLRDF